MSGVQAQMADLRMRAVRRAYGRVYPGLSWEEATERGREEAFAAMTPDDVFAVVETSLYLSEALVSL